MAGFPFGGGGGGQQQRGNGGGIPPSESLFLYGGRGGRGEDLGYTRGFELWQQHQIYSSMAFPDELPFAAARSLRGARAGGSSVASGGGISCQDCGNQAKKDCANLRCRTCCKSRGFHCPTHVKSTWVPAAKRRERQQQLVAAAADKQEEEEEEDVVHRGGGGREGSGEYSKRPREITTIATTSAYGGGGSLDPDHFPPEVSAEAMFRCVRVSPVDEADDEYAYQTTVSIAGHVFKGILYDHGTDGDAADADDHHHSSSSSRYQLNHGEASSSPGATPFAPGPDTAAAVNAAQDLLEPYPTPLSAFMAGTPFFPHQHRP